jgi:Zn-dependent protease
VPHAIVKVILYLAMIVLAVSVHEAAHAAMAWRLGDGTARAQGRMTLWPFAHMDIWGTLVLPAVFLSVPAHTFLAYGKPTPVDPGKLWRPKIGYSLVALAGPLGNLALALALTAFGALAFVYFGIEAPQARTLVSAGIVTNAVLAVLNLLPLPGFDGLKVLYVVLPDAWCWRLQRFERYFLVVLVLVVWTELLAWALAPGWRLGSTLCDLAGIGLSAL